QDNSSVKHYVWSANQLLRKGKLVVGNDNQLRQEILKFVHEGSQGRHLRMQATLKRLSAQVYWRKMRKEVKEYVRTCCLNLLWTDIFMDFIDGLPMSKGRTMLMVVVDTLSKYGHFILLTHP
ncbi:transposon ty3-I gag-pol polyprotein, partial [Tanacetum coccineum]